MDATPPVLLLVLLLLGYVYYDRIGSGRYGPTGWMGGIGRTAIMISPSFSVGYAR
jgi:hypothetical protein